MNKLKRKIITSLGIYLLGLFFTPYIYDVFNKNVKHLLNYFNPVNLISFYKDKLMLFAGIGILTAIALILLDSSNNDMVIEHEDVARLATKDEIKKNFKKLSIERSHNVD